MPPNDRPSFGILTAPMQVDYADIQRVWREADAIPQIAHAWLFDHLMPIAGNPDGPIFEGWTLLSALAGQTDRLRLGLMVTSNRFRPAALLAKIATTVDIVSGGRLDFGIGVGSLPTHPLARREYTAHGLGFADTKTATGTFAEALTVIRRLWTEQEPFDFHGEYIQLAGALGNPRPVQQPHPPIMIGGRAPATLRVVAEHADIWNFPLGTPETPRSGGGPLRASRTRSVPSGSVDDIVNRGALLDRYCAEIGRDPAEITRSVHIPVSADEPARTKDAIAAALDVGVRHIILGLTPPYPAEAARWVTDEFIVPSS